MSDSITIFIGMHADPTQRLKMRISKDDYAKLPRGTVAEAMVTDLDTGKQHHLATADCSLGACRCAIVFVN
jgi:hypothetical protein